MKEYKLRIDGKPYDVTVKGITGSVAEISVNGVGYKVEIGTTDAAHAPATAASSAPAAAPAVPSPVSARPSSGGRKVTSPLPGIILSVCVKEGQKVSRGQKVAVIEAMKMENEILAPCGGTVTTVSVDKGDSVPEGADILTID